MSKLVSILLGLLLVISLSGGRVAASEVDPSEQAASCTTQHVQLFVKQDDGTITIHNIDLEKDTVRSLREKIIKKNILLGKYLEFKKLSKIRKNRARRHFTTLYWAKAVKERRKHLGLSYGSKILKAHVLLKDYGIHNESTIFPYARWH